MLLWLLHGVWYYGASAGTEDGSSARSGEFRRLLGSGDRAASCIL